MMGKALNIILVHLVCFLINYLPALVVQSLRTQIHILDEVFVIIASLGVVCGHIQP